MKLKIECPDGRWTSARVVDAETGAYLDGVNAVTWTCDPANGIKCVITLDEVVMDALALNVITSDLTADEHFDAIMKEHSGNVMICESDQHVWKSGLSPYTKSAAEWRYCDICRLQEHAWADAP